MNYQQGNNTMNIPKIENEINSSTEDHADNSDASPKATGYMETDNSTVSMNENEDQQHKSPKKRSKVFRRNYRSCINCRIRKVKCDLGPLDNPHPPPCRLCRRQRKECVFVESKRGGIENIRAGKKRKLLEQQEQNQQKVAAAAASINILSQNDADKLASLSHSGASMDSQQQQQQQQQQSHIYQNPPLTAPGMLMVSTSQQVPPMLAQHQTVSNLRQSSDGYGSSNGQNSQQIQQQQQQQQQSLGTIPLMDNKVVNAVSIGRGELAPQRNTTMNYTETGENSVNSTSLSSTNNSTENSTVRSTPVITRIDQQNLPNTTFNGNVFNGNLPQEQKPQTGDTSQFVSPDRDENMDDDEIPPTLQNKNSLSSVSMASGKSQKDSISSLSNSATPRTDLNGSGTSTMIFLAHIAGNIAKADGRDNVDARSRYEEIEKSASLNSSRKSSSVNLSKRESTETLSGSEQSPAITDKPDSDSQKSPSVEIVNENESQISDNNKKDQSTYNKSSRNDSNSMPPPPKFEPDDNEKKAAVLPEAFLKEQFGQGSTFFPSIRPSMPSRHRMPAVKSTLMVRPTPSAKLSDIEYIGEDSILSESDARRLIVLFFTSMHPFFPYIPKELHDADVLAGFPMLLCVILTVSARYHPLEADEKPHENRTVPFHVEVHERLWVYCQRLISQTVWAEASTRSIGTCLAFLLFTEWNPRAIHWRWSDYANLPEDDLRTSASGAGVPDSENSLAGLGAMIRSNRMAFMLIGTSVRLAQNTGFIEDHPLVFLATHIAETNSAININSSSMLSRSLTEVDLDWDEDEENEDKEDNSRSYLKLKFTPYQKANIELLQFMSLCYESLYSKKSKLGYLDKYQNLAILNILSPLLENWYRRYYKLLERKQFLTYSSGNHNNLLLRPNSKYAKDIASQIQTESLIFDYYYAKLYIYSLALGGDTTNRNEKTKKGKKMKLNELAKYSRYVELAYKSAKEVLSVMQRVHKLKLLKYMPVRWVTRMVKAVAFIVKCYLTLTTNPRTDAETLDAVSHKKNGKPSEDPEHSNDTTAILTLSVISLEEIISTIQKCAIALRDATPDELHLCTRYSTILMYLVSQFKSKIHERDGVNIDYEQTFNNELKLKKEKELEKIKKQTFE
ncbi:unnamed protein product [[Candida] boidinii]|uniref:Unnamed protein product n=1 Tax=Candida boidinii TaxID=5477 RepID=A0ACB5TGL1_CANBO|nr:unnamed protein product [[Candida] boidinii]